MKVSIKKEMLVNCGNFSNVKVSIEMEKDIEEGKNFFTEYQKLTNLVDSSLIKEIIGPTEELNTMLKMGVNNYIENITENESELIKSIKDNSK